MKQLGGVEFDYLFLMDADLQPCRGCFACLSKGEQFCPLLDDRESIVQRMLDSDGVILVSPVYVLNVTALMKNFIDRLAYICHRPLFFRQHAMVLSTTGGVGLRPVL
jgi:multimeric flavodoxin WrbA